MRAGGGALLGVLALFALAGAVRGEPAARTWEINGIRLEPGQVERLADDIAERTVAAVEAGVADLALHDGQRQEMRAIYREVALDVYGEVVREVARSDLGDAEKEARVRELVLAGQRRSHQRLESVLDARQMTLYAAWEDKQVAAFQNRRLDRGPRRRRR
jgi:hypothetical protein